MRTVVALVEAQPETIQQDYQRVMSLAKLPASRSQSSGQGSLNLLLDAPSKKFEPGFGATPWQLEGVLAQLGSGASTAQIATVDGGGVAAFEANLLGPRIAAVAGRLAAKKEFLRTHRHVGSALHPALDEVLSQGVQLPVGLADGHGILLSSPTLAPGWGVAGTVRMLQKLVLAGHKIPRRTSFNEVVAESLALSLELMSQTSAVLDGTIWGVARGDGRPLCMARNVLLAGNDPLAVDVVAMRLAGLNPANFSWVRLCQERGIGHSRADEISVVGRTDLLDLDFELGGGTIGATPALALTGIAAPLRAAWDRFTGLAGRGPREGRFKDTVWSGLYGEYENETQSFETV